MTCPLTARTMSQFSPAAIRQDVPFGVVTTMVHVPEEEANNSSTCPGWVTPTPIGASLKLSPSDFTICSRGPHCACAEADEIRAGYEAADSISNAAQRGMVMEPPEPVVPARTLVAAGQR